LALRRPNDDIRQIILVVQHNLQKLPHCLPGTQPPAMSGSRGLFPAVVAVGLGIFTGMAVYDALSIDITS
jgi:hypothetical protein